MSDRLRAHRRNVTIFCLAVLFLGNIAGLFSAVGGGLGGLLFILSPAIVTIAMRTLGRDGWKDAGFRPNFRKGRTIYLAALLLFPTLIAVDLLIGCLTGFVSFPVGAAEVFLRGVAAGLLPVLLYVLSEEIAWRGYLEPRLAALGTGPATRVLIVSVVWGAWHVGYVLSQPDYTTLSVPLFFVLFFASVIPMTMIYGIWRQKTGSFLPALVAHSVANMLLWPLGDESVAVVEVPLVFSARPEGLVILVGLWIVALATWNRTHGRQTV